MSSENASTEKPPIDESEVEEILDALDDIDPEADDEASDHTRRVLKAAAVVPIHQVKRTAAGRKIRRGPGRPPKKVHKSPTEEDLQYHQQVMEEQTEFIDSDEMVKAARERKPSLETLQLLKERLAMAGANLQFQQIELQKRGNYREVPIVISRQISAMKELANIELQISQFQASIFNLRDERLQRVFALLIETFRDVAKEMIPPEQFDLLWNRLETALEGWEDKADSLVR
jgi:hypothetical protein